MHVFCCLDANSASRIVDASQCLSGLADLQIDKALSSRVTSPLAYLPILRRNEQLMSIRLSVSVLFTTLLLALGCKSWDQSANNSTLKLPTPRLAMDSIGVDLTFVRVPPNEQDLEQTIWAEADEQCIPPELRAHLNANGIRCGVIGRQLPTALVRLLDESDTHDLNRDEIRETDVLTRARHQRWKAGRRVPIVATTALPSLVLLHRESGSDQLTGQTFSEAQGFLAAKPYPQQNGQVRIELTPEIHFGAVNQRWIAGEGTWHLKSGKERHVLADLQMKLKMAPGQALLVSCTADHSGVGRTLFIDSTGGDPQQKMLFLRIAQLQHEELFDNLLTAEKGL